MIDYSVVIIGAGPSGLALAIELGSRGIKCLLVERNDRVGHAPRSKTTNVRTRTHLRRWGIADQLAQASPFGVDYPSNVHFVTKLSGPSLAKIENASNCAPIRNQHYPEHGQWIPQYKLERVLRDHVATLPTITLLFNTEFLSATYDDNHVSTKLHDEKDDLEMVVQSNYLVGADGARSSVRQLIGAKMSGSYGLSRNYNIIFRAPGLAQAHRHGPGSMYWQINSKVPSLIGPMDRDDIWFFMPTRLPEGFEITPQSAMDLIRDATGIDLPYEILSSDEWVASSLMADRYRDGPIFLIGDACHLHPPFGGYGMNMGIADGVDLGWKLAAVLEGWGGPHLLESYVVERRGIHEAVMAEAAANHAVLSNDLWHEDLEDVGIAGDVARRAVGDRILALKKREFNTLGTVLGLCLENSPIIEPDETLPSTHDSENYIPSNRPGCLAPHIWRGEKLSLYDEFGSGFTLICAPGAAPSEILKAQAEARDLNISLAVISLAACEPSSSYATPLTLVRPDQYVAWRGSDWPPNMLTKVTGWAEVTPRAFPPLNE